MWVGDYEIQPPIYNGGIKKYKSLILTIDYNMNSPYTKGFQFNVINVSTAYTKHKLWNE